VGKDGQANALLPAGDPCELAGLALTLDFVEKGFEHLYTAGIADENQTVCELVGADMDVEHGAVAVDDEFGFRDSHGKSVMWWKTNIVFSAELSYICTNN
jgi:hypothetical protein